MSVYVTTYEVIGEGLPAAEAHFAQVDAAKDAHWKYVESVGGLGFRPSSFGGLRSVFFADVPAGWRKIGRDREKVECLPLKNTATGRSAAKDIAQLPQAPEAGALARSLGYAPSEMAIDGTSICFPTTLQVIFPVKRTFLRLPRFSRDGFEPDETTLRALPESEFMKAVEDHNAEAKRQREAGE